MPTTFVTIRLILALLPIASAPVEGADSWTLLYQEEGIIVFEDGGNPPSYKAEGTLAADQFELLAVLADIPRRTEWVNQLVETRAVEGDPESEVLMYSRFNLPWPVADRDSTIRSKINVDYERREVRVRFHTVEKASLPPKDGIVRVPLAKGEFFIKAKEPQSVFVRYQLTMDPGGWLPEWVAKMFVKEAPVRTLRALAKQVEQTRGQYRDFIHRHRLQLKEKK